MDAPETRYAKTADDVYIAYQVVGDGPRDLVYLPEWVSNVELQWQEARHARFLRRLASLARLIVVDRRGTGLSDRITATPTIEASMDDVLAVMGDVGSDRATLFGVLEGACVCSVFAATYPERTDALILHGAYARGLPAADYPWAWTEEHWREEDELIEHMWGTEAYSDQVLQYSVPSSANDPELRRWWANQNRLTMSPGAALALGRMQRELDLRRVLPLIQVPTLVTHRTGDQVARVEEGRYVAESIPGARFKELPGMDHPPWAGDQDAVLTEVERFLTSIREAEAEFDRVLATVLFTDIVDSTTTAAQMGDRAWRDLLERHHATVRSLLGRYRGAEVDTAGDGFFATFDGPARAARCAQTIVEAMATLGLEVRAGLHTGEVETIDGKVGGIAVAIGARIGSNAGASEVWASSTVKDLTAGSGLVFDDAGEHELKGIPDRWHLYRVVDGP